MEIAAKLGRCNGSKYWTTELRNDARIRMLKRIEDDPNNHPNRKLCNNRKQMSYPERLVFDYLTNKGIKFEHNKYIKPYWPDFCIDNIIIEVDGKRWHNPEKDAIKDKNLTERGYIVFRFDTKDIVKNVSIIDKALSIGD